MPTARHHTPDQATEAPGRFVLPSGCRTDLPGTPGTTHSITVRGLPTSGQGAPRSGALCPLGLVSGAPTAAHRRPGCPSRRGCLAAGLHLTPLGPPVKQSAIAARITRTDTRSGGPATYRPGRSSIVHHPPFSKPTRMLTYPLSPGATKQKLGRELPAQGQAKEDPTGGRPCHVPHRHHVQQSAIAARITRTRSSQGGSNRAASTVHRPPSTLFPPHTLPSSRGANYPR
jgi:hypothetical protein